MFIRSCFLLSRVKHENSFITLGPGKTQSTLLSYKDKINKNIEILLVVSLASLLSRKRITKVLLNLHRCTGWSAALLFVCCEVRYSCTEARFSLVSIVHVGGNRKLLASIVHVYDFMR